MCELTTVEGTTKQTEGDLKMTPLDLEKATTSLKLEKARSRARRW
ncbi:hypothetical protein PF001_g30593 [Phytophthora fragariae]|uniref:Uncharacterized protein n=1 Tax=Phytophthora fragariae TaxID=53985 RepID=A0A6A4B126_9STRA|nr:hypothetical protein PF001_g30593 [Phytophthora fragariae]